MAEIVENQISDRLPADRGLADVQYQIWTTFMRSTANDLRNKELRIIAQSGKLIDAYQSSKELLRDLDITDDVSSTKNTIIERESTSRAQSPDSKLLLRKSPRGAGKTFNFMFLEELKEVEQKCSPETTTMMRRLLQEYKRMKQVTIEAEANEKRITRQLQILQKDHEHLQILKKVNEEAQKKLKKVEIQNLVLKKKQKELGEKIGQLKNSDAKSATLESLGIPNLTNYLNEKEKNITTKLEKVQSIEKNILDVVGGQVQDDGCDKCCSFLRKIKDSVVKLRRSLIEEGEQIEGMYSRYKSIFCRSHY